MKAVNPAVPVVSAVTLTALLGFLLTATAHAEWRVGTEFGLGKSTLDAQGDLTDGSEKDSASSFNLFGQWRTASSNRVSYGVHLGYGQDGSEYEDSATVAIDLQDFGVGNQADVGDATIGLEASQDKTFDLLAVIAWNRDGVSPYLMAGYTSAELDAEVNFTGSNFDNGDFNGTLSVKDDTTLKGYKLVAGVEGEFAENWVWHSAIEYADYGDEKLTYTIGDIEGAEEVELDKTSVRFGIAYRF